MVHEGPDRAPFVGPLLPERHCRPALPERHGGPALPERHGRAGGAEGAAAGASQGTCSEYRWWTLAGGAARLRRHRDDFVRVRRCGDGLGSVGRSESPPRRRRDHDGRPARADADGLGPRRRIAHRFPSLDPSWAGRPARPYYRLPAGERRDSEGRAPLAQEPKKTEGTLAGRRRVFLFVPRGKAGDR
jgi:hypothetical protein